MQTIRFSLLRRRCTAVPSRGMNHCRIYWVDLAKDVLKLHSVSNSDFGKWEFFRTSQVKRCVEKSRSELRLQEYQLLSWDETPTSQAELQIPKYPDWPHWPEDDWSSYCRVANIGFISLVRQQTAEPSGKHVNLNNALFHPNWRYFVSVWLCNSDLMISVLQISWRHVAPGGQEPTGVQTESILKCW